MAAKAVATNKALPRPHIARYPTMALIESDDPAKADPIIITIRPSNRVFH